MICRRRSRSTSALVVAVLCIGAPIRGASSVVSCAELAQASRRFPPVQAADGDAKYRSFRDALLVAAQRGDIDALIANVAPVVRVPEATVTAKQLLEQQNVRQGRPWLALVQALELGSVAASNGRYAAPYLAEAGVEGAVVVGRNVRLRSAPSPKAPVVSTLDYHEVELLADHVFYPDARDAKEATSWAHVRVSEGLEGYVFVGLLWIPGSPRFYFEQIGGNWKLVAFGEGD